MLLHYFLGKIEAKFGFMSKCEENNEGHKFVLRDRTCKKSVASDFFHCLHHYLLHEPNIKDE